MIKITIHNQAIWNTLHSANIAWLYVNLFSAACRSSTTQYTAEDWVDMEWNCSESGVLLGYVYIWTSCLAVSSSVSSQHILWPSFGHVQSISAWPLWLSRSNLHLLPLYLQSCKYYFITPVTFLHVFQPACSLHPPLLWVIATVVLLWLKAIKNTYTVAFLTLSLKAKMCSDEDIIFSRDLH